LAFFSSRSSLSLGLQEEKVTRNENRHPKTKNNIN